METALRARRKQVQLLRNGGAGEDDITIARCKYQAQLDEYKRFSKVMGLQEQMERVYTGRTAGRIVPSAKVYANWQAEQSNRAKERQEKKRCQDMRADFPMSANDGILSEKDIYALNQYKKSHVAYPLNSILRGEAHMTEEFRQAAHSIDQALLKLPPYQGTVYRSLDSTYMADVQAFWKRYSVGSYVVESSYISSSTEVYDDTMDIQMIIQSKRGCDMRKYNPLEQEILFRRGSMFFVQKREGNTLWLIEI